MKLKLITTMIIAFPFMLTAQYTLDNCETDISGPLPAFFQKYFQCVTARLSESGNYVNLYYTGLAPYDSWYYPQGNANHIDYVSQGQGYFQVPNAYITEYDYVVSIPVNPVARQNLVINASAVDGEVGTSNFEYPMGSVGSALNGVNMFNPCASPPDVIEDEAYSFDYYSGHPAGPSGIYHYHTTSKGPLEVLQHKGLIQTATVGSGEIEVYGIMCDGVVVLGCTELDGSDPNSADWDAQNGHVHDMVDEEGTLMFSNRYHTHVCYDEITDADTDGNGYPEHEFTPEISYYKTEGMGQTYNRCGAMTAPFEDDMVSVENDWTPSQFVLYPNYPNPFNPTTTIEYDIAKSGIARMVIYDVNGRKVKTLKHGHHNPGLKSVIWDGTNDLGLSVSAGVYIYQLETAYGVWSQKMLMLK